MNDADLEFRVATHDDWAGIWPIFSAVVEPGDTYSYAPDLDEQAARAAWMLDGVDRAATYVATLERSIVATAQLKPNQPGLGDHVANAGWMVDPAAAGRGIGRRFAEFIIDEALRLGYCGMQFNAVVATNTRAVALWESLGFEIVGTVPAAFRHAVEGPVGLHIMYRELCEIPDAPNSSRP